LSGDARRHGHEAGGARVDRESERERGGVVRTTFLRRMRGGVVAGGGARGGRRRECDGGEEEERRPRPSEAREKVTADR
jgi:hypothetical protein